MTKGYMSSTYEIISFMITGKRCIPESAQNNSF